MSKKIKIELRDLPEGLTEAEINTANSYRAIVNSDKRNVFLEKLFREFGPMTEADAAARLVGMGIYGWRIVFARLDESRGDKGGGVLRRAGTKISPSTGMPGCIWKYVPPENREERAVAVLEHWQDRLARDQKISIKIQKRIEKAQQRLEEVGRRINVGNFTVVI